MPIDGSATPTKLNGPLVFGGGVYADPQVSPDGTCVVYRAELDASNVIELFSVPIDGGVAPVKLNGPIVIGGDVTGPFAISPDGQWVVYVAEQDDDRVGELYSVPIDGSEAAVKLSIPLAFGDFLREFQISADSIRVVYRATINKNDLFSVPIDGSFPSVQLNSASVSTGFHVTADATRVVYIADEDTPGVRELYSIPIDGSSSSLKLNAPLVSGGDVNIATLSLDDARVVYRADQDTDNVWELYSTLLDGSGTTVKLNGPLVSGGWVSNFFQISGDSATVVYLADAETAAVNELYSVPIDGDMEPTKLNGPLVSGGEVMAAFQIDPNTVRVVYLADEDVDQVFELYSSVLQ